MNDRELLEKAAKAAGIEFTRFDGSNYPLGTSRTGWGLVVGASADWDGMRCHYWNPLTDDGDALRLAVKLDLTVMIYSLEKITRVWQSCNGGFEDTPHESDPQAATRRAIVRAAAAIGEAMP